VIEWLNKNQGFVTALLTFVYVITTIALAYFALRSQRLAQRHLQLTLELEDRRTRPYLTFDVVIRSGLVYATLRNSGRSAVFDVKVDIVPQINRQVGDRLMESGLTKHLLGCVAPGLVLEDVINSGPTFLSQFKEPVFRVG
jgi:hypothetical protein